MNALEKPKGDVAEMSVKQLVSLGKSEEDILNHLRQHSYDKFVLKIINFQVSFMNIFSQLVFKERILNLFKIFTNRYLYLWQMKIGEML